MLIFIIVKLSIHVINREFLDP